MPGVEAEAEGKMAESAYIQQELERAMRSGGHLAGVGVDGCPEGWIAALGYVDRDATASFLGFRLFRGNEGFGDLVDWCESLPARPILGVDVPIGLPALGGPRACDAQARARLGPRWMCVFSPPDRALLGLSFEEAREVVRARRAANHPGSQPIMTKQTMAIAPKIAEVDGMMRANLARQAWIVEVHPEISFLTMAKHVGQAVPKAGLAPKKRGAGYRQRVDLLSRVFPNAAKCLTNTTWPRSKVGRDDPVDALVALWSALRFAQGQAGQLGGERDGLGVLARIAF